MPISEYTNPVQNTLEQYVPLPLEQIYKAASSIQQRGDLAQGQSDQVQTGLSSMEALAPGQKDFVNTFANDFKTQQGALLDKYHGNTSDPNYEQESRKLNMQFAADPRLQTIKQTNELLKKKQNIKDELDAKGIKYLDSNPSFSGTDNNGNLLSNVGSLAATNFDTNINQAFKDKENAIEQVGHRLTNTRNLGKVHDTYVHQDGTLNTDNPDIQQGLSYYKQQGLNDMQAAAKVRSHVDQGLGYAHDLKDHFYEISPYQQEELKLQWAEEADKKAKAAATIGPPPFELQTYKKPIVPTGTDSQEVSNNETPNSELFHKIEKVKEGLTTDGNLNAGERRVDDTPENRVKYGKSATPVQDIVAGGGMGYGTSSYNQLSVKDRYDPEEVSLLNTAKKMVGTGPGLSSAKQILSKYQDMIKNSDEASYGLTSTNNSKLNSVMADVARRQISTGEIYKLQNGKIVKVDSKELGDIQTSTNGTDKDNEVKNMQIAGISPKTLGPLNGFTQFSNKGVNYYTGIPEEMQRRFSGSKSVENYIQDFDPKNLTPTTIKDESGAKRNVYINPKQEPIPYQFKGHSGRMIPFKLSDGNKISGGGLFQEMDPSTGRDIGSPIPIPVSELEKEEQTSLHTRVVNDNKIKGD